MNASVFAPTLGSGFAAPAPSTMAFTLKNQLKSEFELSTDLSKCQKIVANMFNLPSFEALKSVEAKVGGKQSTSPSQEQHGDRLVLLSSSDGPQYDIYLLAQPGVDMEKLKSNIRRFLVAEATLEHFEMLEDESEPDMVGAAQMYKKLMGEAQSIEDYFRRYGAEKFGVDVLSSTEICFDVGNVKPQLTLSDLQGDLQYFDTLEHQPPNFGTGALNGQSLDEKPVISCDRPQEAGCVDFTLNASGAWVRAGLLSIWIRKTHQGVIVDTWPVGSCSTEPISTSCYTYDDLMEMVLKDGSEDLMAMLALEYGVEIKPDCDQPGLWVWSAGVKGACEHSLSSVKEAFEDAWEIIHEAVAEKEGA